MGGAGHGDWPRGQHGLSTGPHLHFRAAPAEKRSWVAVDPGELDAGPETSPQQRRHRFADGRNVLGAWSGPSSAKAERAARRQQADAPTAGRASRRLKSAHGHRGSGNSPSPGGTVRPSWVDPSTRFILESCSSSKDGPALPGGVGIKGASRFRRLSRQAGWLMIAGRSPPAAAARRKEFHSLVLERLPRPTRSSVPPLDPALADWRAGKAGVDHRQHARCPGAHVGLAGGNCAEDEARSRGAQGSAIPSSERS